MLAQIYAAWADGAAPPPAGQTPASLRDKAIDHLVAIQGSPLMATDPNLQMTLGRLYLRAGRAKDAVPVLEKVVAQVPWAAEPFALLAEGRTALGRIDEAAEALAAAAEINPRYWVTLGGSLRAPGQMGRRGRRVWQRRAGRALAEPRPPRAMGHGAPQCPFRRGRAQGSPGARRAVEGHAR